MRALEGGSTERWRRRSYHQAEPYLTQPAAASREEPDSLLWWTRGSSPSIDPPISRTSRSPDTSSPFQAGAARPGGISPPSRADVLQLNGIRRAPSSISPGDAERAVPPRGEIQHQRDNSRRSSEVVSSDPTAATEAARPGRFRARVGRSRHRRNCRCIPSRPTTATTLGAHHQRLAVVISEAGGGGGVNRSGDRAHRRPGSRVRRLRAGPTSLWCTSG